MSDTNPAANPAESCVSMDLRERRLENFKRLARTPDSIRGTNLGAQRKEKELRLYQETMDIPTLLKMRAG